MRLFAFLVIVGAHLRLFGSRSGSPSRATYALPLVPSILPVTGGHPMRELAAGPGGYDPPSGVVDELPKSGHELAQKRLTAPSNTAKITSD